MFIKGIKNAFFGEKTLNKNVCKIISDQLKNCYSTRNKTISYESAVNVELKHWYCSSLINAKVSKTANIENTEINVTMHESTIYFIFLYNFTTNNPQIT